MPHSFPTLSSSVLVFVVRFADDGSVSFFGHCRLTFVSENGGADECAEAESLGDVAVVGGDRGQAEATRHFNEAGPLVGGEVAICAVLFRKNEFRSEEHTSDLQSLMRSSYAVLCLKQKSTRLTMKRMMHGTHL